MADPNTSQSRPTTSPTLSGDAEFLRKTNQPTDEFPLTAKRENRARKRSMFLIGLTTLLLYAAPIPMDQGMGSAWVFFPIAYLGELQASVAAALFFLAPLGLGIVTLAVALLAKQRWRALLTMTFGACALIICAAGVIAEDPFFTDFIMHDGMSSPLIKMALIWSFLHIGLRWRAYRPKSIVAYSLAALASFAVILWSFTPIDDWYGTKFYWWNKVQTYYDTSSLLSTIMLVTITSCLAASLACILVLPSFRSRFSMWVARIAYWIFTLSLVVALLRATSNLLPHWGDTVEFLCFAGKLMLMLICTFAFIAIGITDRILGQRRTLTLHCNECGYDLRATHNGVCTECGHLNKHLVSNANVAYESLREGIEGPRDRGE